MAKKNKTKQQKPTKKQPETTKIDKKNLKRKKLRKTAPKKDTQIPTPTPYDSDSDSDSSDAETDSDKLQKLLEPCTKDQLIQFVVDAAATDPSLLARVRAAADGDVTHRKIFVFGLGWDATRETLASAFGTYGEIEECNVITDRATGKAKGYGFVLFKTRQGANKSLKQPRKKIGNRMASCQLASAGPAAVGTAAAAQPTQDAAGRKIYVSNVPADADSEKLRSFFAKFGEIEAGPMGFDMYTGKSRGFALFVYKTLEGARKSLQEPYKSFEGSQLHCQKAADGKNKAAAAAVTPVQPVQAPVLAAMAAAQNSALFGQNPSLNPHLALFSQNPNLALFSQNPYLMNPNFGMGLGGYGAAAAGSQGMGSFGGGSHQSVLGAYGTSSGPMAMGMQYAYPSSQIGQTSSSAAKAPPGSGGSFSGYPS